MKKGWIIGIIAVLLVIILVIVFYPKPVEDNEEYDADATNEEPITFLSGWINTLEECKGYSEFSSQEEMIDAGYNQFCWDTTDIDDVNLSKLNSLKNIKGIFISDNYNVDLFNECKLIWQYDSTHIGAKLYHRTLKVYECNNQFYLLGYAYPGFSERTVYMINPSEEVINKLKI